MDLPVYSSMLSTVLDRGLGYIFHRSKDVG